MNTRPKIVPKPWGYEKIIVNNDEYCGKLLFFHAAHGSSLHYHKLKDETFYIQSGSVKVDWSDETKTKKTGEIAGLQTGSVILKKGEKFHIPRGRVHQITALEDTELFEFSTQHFDSDSIRLKDRYGRDEEAPAE